MERIAIQHKLATQRNNCKLWLKEDAIPRPEEGFSCSGLKCKVFYLKECAKSALEQTFMSFDAICPHAYTAAFYLAEYLCMWVKS